MFARCRIVLVALVCACTPAAASGYSDFNQAINAQRRNDHASAIRLIGQALAASDLPAHLRAAAFLVRGDSELGLRQWDKAAASFGACLALKPDWIEALLHRDVAYAQLEQYGLAVADLDRVIAQRPRYSLSYVARGGVHELQGRYDDAVSDYTRLIGLEPEAAYGYLLRAHAQRLKGDFGQALNDYNRTIAIAPGQPTPYMSRGQLYQDQGEYGMALSDFQKAHTINPDLQGPRFLIGIAQWELGRFDEAAAQFNLLARAADPDPYSVLWFKISNARAKTPALDIPISLTVTADDDKWPAPLLEMFKGQTTPEAARKAAQNGTAKERRMHACEADFYAGQWRLTRSEPALARALLESAVKECPLDAIERAAARAELGRRS